MNSMMSINNSDVHLKKGKDWVPLNTFSGVRRKSCLEKGTTEIARDVTPSLSEALPAFVDYTTKT